MPVIGTGTFFPQGGFAFPRSYVGNVALPSDWDLEAQIDNFFIFNDFRFYNDRIFIRFLPQFWAWSSNRYTLDHCVIDCYYYPLPSTTPTPTPYSLSWLPATTTHNATLKLLSPFFGSGIQYFPLPPRDQPYWLPDW